MLNSGQKIALEVEMRHLERSLRQARQWLRQPPEDYLLTRHRPFPETAGPELEAIIEPMLAEIAVLKERFRLAPEVDDLGRDLEAEMAAAWADMTDTLSPKLVRYGPVDPALAEALDPSLRRLIAWSHELARASLRASVAPRANGAKSAE
jgi:hypothetical protein